MRHADMKRPGEGDARRAYAGLALALVACAALTGCPSPRSLIYPAPQPRPIEPMIGGRIIEFEVRDGETGYALHHPAPASAPTVVFFHGNGDQLAHLTWLGGALAARGLGFYAIEYPGYGPANAQTPSEDAIYATAEAALVHLRDSIGVANERTVLMGQSLGTGVAVEMATRGFGARVVLVSPYTSIPDLAEQTFSSAARLVITDTYDTKAKAPGMSLPVLIAHGSRDTLIPISMARTLDATFPHSQLHVIDRAGHNDVWHVGGSAWLVRLDAFARGASGRS